MNSVLFSFPKFFSLFFTIHLEVLVDKKRWASLVKVFQCQNTGTRKKIHWHSNSNFIGTLKRYVPTKECFHIAILKLD